MPCLLFLIPVALDTFSVFSPTFLLKLYCFFVHQLFFDSVFHVNPSLIQVKFDFLATLKRFQ